MNEIAEEARDTLNLAQLRDPILFERLVHYGEKVRQGRAYSVLSPCYPDVMSLEQWQRDFEPAVIDAMAANLKDKVPDPKGAAIEALRTFRDRFAKSAAAFEMAYAILAVDTDFSALHAAATEMQRSLSSLRLQSLSELFLLFEDWDQSLPAFRATLNDLVQFTEKPLLEIEGRAGERPTIVFNALHAACECLMDTNGADLWQASKALAAMLDAHPDFEGKTVRNIYNTISKRQGEVNRSGYPQLVFLDPGRR